MCILTTLSANPTAIKIMTNKRVLRSFLSYVVPSDHPSGNWNFAQFEELQLMVGITACWCWYEALVIADCVAVVGIVVSECPRSTLRGGLHDLPGKLQSANPGGLVHQA